MVRDFLRSPVVILLAISALYIGVLLWADRQQSVSQQLDVALLHMPYLFLATVVSYFFRFYRWWWLLRRVGYSFPLGRGLMSYLAGFAYTATPGKVGELIRIRYFAKFGVPAECTFGTFIFERSCDLIAVLLLSLFILNNSGFLPIAIGFVLFIVGGVVFCALRPGLFQSMERFFARWHIPLVPKILAFLYSGVGYCRGWLNAVDILIGLGLGLAAWTVVGLSFVYLQASLGGGLPFLEVLSIYPLSMLVGAASMIPGGVGSTEGAMVYLLGQYGVAVGTALLLAVVIRIATLWFGILVGFCALGYLEFYWRRHGGSFNAGE